MKRTKPQMPVANACIVAATAFIVAVAPAHANDLSVSELCDREAGSEADRERNPAFAPVASEDIRIGIALSACREAYNQQGGPRIQFQLARVLERAGETLKSFGILGEAAENGHTLAMVNYGVRLVERGDPEAALDFYRRAAAAGNSLAAYHLAIAYREGIGTTVDEALAAQWLTAAGRGQTLSANRTAIGGAVRPAALGRNERLN
ncbi:sel1 repeat family protein [Ensifer sp. LCM 4579]|uniref:sel1 repeat family protein n=1 Tax=Ensifer sp. LCM 4579 TaxID=1848292 RepID=UPI000A7CCF7A|nr:sel1 repeat family protein [Ensifer sp. LCM 4579]